MILWLLLAAAVQGLLERNRLSPVADQHTHQPIRRLGRERVDQRSGIVLLDALNRAKHRAMVRPGSWGTSCALRRTEFRTPHLPSPSNRPDATRHRRRPAHPKQLTPDASCLALPRLKSIRPRSVLLLLLPNSRRLPSRASLRSGRSRGFIGFRRTVLGQRLFDDVHPQPKTHRRSCGACRVSGVVQTLLQRSRSRLERALDLANHDGRMARIELGIHHLARKARPARVMQVL